MAFTTGVLLLLLTLTAFVELDKIAAVSISVADLQRQRWREKLPDVEIPQQLVGHLSPLSLTQLQYFATVLNNKSNDAASFDADQFCSSADLLCSQDVPYVPAAVSAFGSPPSSDGAPTKSLHLFVDKKELRESGEITLPDLRSPITWKSFLPRELAELMPPLSFANRSQILTLFNIPRESNMSRNMVSTLGMCDGSVLDGEVRRCSASVEGMVEFVVFALGSDVELVSDSSIVGSGERFNVTRAARRENVKGKPPLACHSFVFPYGVFFCHYINGSETFDLQLEMVQNEKRVTRNATVVCHYFSHGGPGKEPACHAVYGDMFLWLAKTKIG